MPFRTVCISNRCKLEYSLNYLVCKGEEEKRIHLSEINTLIIQTTAVAITGSLLSELSERKIKVIFCDAKMNPQSELIPYYGAHNSSIRIKEQATWDSCITKKIWAKIVKEKIRMQANVLIVFLHKDSADMLYNYSNEIIEDDITNREGHAAKVYFNALFSKDFSRSGSFTENSFLNYGYAIILSAVNREIVGHGYLTQLGIHHCNEFNPFNLSCDLMEPFRPIVDHYAVSGKLTEDNFKKELNKMLSINVRIQGKEMTLDNAIRIYIQSIFSAISSGSPDQIHFLDSYDL